MDDATPVSGEHERLVVVWRVTTRCQLSCGFCAYDRRLPFARREVDVTAARRLSHSLLGLRETSGRPLHVSFLGGEPLLWSPLVSVARELASRGVSLGITTNAALLQADWARQLLFDCFDELTVSVDGLEEVHDRLRGCPGGLKRVARAVQELVQIRAARGRGPLVRVNTVLMRDNVQQFSELCRMLAGWGVDELTFNRLGGRDRPEFFAAHRLSPTELEGFVAALPALRRELRAQGLRIRGAPAYVERLLSLERGEALRVRDCRAGRHFLFIDEHGTVAPCSFTLAEYGEHWPTTLSVLEHAPELPRRFLVRQAARRASACDDCMSTQIVGKFGEADGA